MNAKNKEERFEFSVPVSVSTCYTQIQALQLLHCKLFWLIDVNRALIDITPTWQNWGKLQVKPEFSI